MSCIKIGQDLIPPKPTPSSSPADVPVRLTRYDPPNQAQLDAWHENNAPQTIGEHVGAFADRLGRRLFG